MTRILRHLSLDTAVFMSTKSLQRILFPNHNNEHFLQLIYDNLIKNRTHYNERVRQADKFVNYRFRINLRLKYKEVENEFSIRLRLLLPDS